MKLIITEEDKNHILNLYNLTEQAMSSPLQTKNSDGSFAVKTNAEKNNKFVPTDENFKVFLGREGKGDINIVKSFAPKPNTFKTQSEWYNQVAINVLSYLEELKIGKGYWWSVKQCGKCKVSITDTFKKDEDNNQFCGNRELQTNRTWDCEDSLAILYKTYGTYSIPTLISNGFIKGKNGIPQYVSKSEEFWNEYKHELMMVGSIGSLLIPLAGPYLSLLFDAADVAMYLQEGDKKMAGLMAVFALIPLGELSKILGKEILPNSVKGLVSRTHKKLPLTKLDKEIVERIGKNSDVLSRYVSMYGKRAVLYNLLPAEKISLKMWMVLMGKLGKIGYPLTKVGLQIAGVTYGYEQLWKMYHNNPEEYRLVEKKFDKEKPTQQVYNSVEETSRATTQEEEEQAVKIIIKVADISDEEVTEFLDGV